MTAIQSEFDFDNSVIIQQNNKESQEILEDNSEKLSYQCRVILHYLRNGNRITVRRGSLGLFDHWEKNKVIIIGDTRARIRDIRKHIEVKDEKLPGGFKIYYL